ncbi:unnamed protein product [Peronospora belbahrii]|uniref:Fanconi anemia group M protein n=1 Tax=Peronospora belbahrii TaxID=622444 RepID=A0AAU9KRF3_9STRA|nr:unnamed protein product [Peronospora belbahrii]
MEEDEWDDALLSEITALETEHLQTRRGHDNQTSCHLSIVSSDDSSTWNCQSCTLQNEASRSVCVVCTTPRKQFQSPATKDVAKKMMQSTLSFTKRVIPDVKTVTLQQNQEPHRMKRSSLSLLMATNEEQTVTQSQQTIRARELGQCRTLGHSEVDTGVATTTVTTNSLASSPLLQISRHAAGEDCKARRRYLDIETSLAFPDIDYEAAQYFVYPTNYSIREYQLTIAEKALYHNTLVSLPTGLGKTLVAAVVMYNFYQWFPTGKIVFMAPTKPLVAQQIKACHEIMGIPLSDTAELQGNVPPTVRRMLWNSKRVFFCTPQSLQNDLKRGVCAAEKFVCIVVDEAHRATGNYAYCCVVQEIEAKTQFFRVLALSATPGAKFDVIQDVVTNLRISHIESRSADDPDVKRYTHVRQEEVIVCRLGVQIMEVKMQLLKCFTPIVQRLVRGNIIQYSDPEKLTSWYVLQAREKFRKSPSYASNRSAESDLALLVSLLHAKSLLTGHGLSSFCDQIKNWVEERKKGKMSWSKREMLQSSDFQSLELSVAVTASSSNTASHPKLVKLREVLLEHFQRHAAGKSSTRAIVFTQYRASVSEIVALLRPLAPLLNAQPFIGQGASGKAKENKGQSQKVQQEIVRRFRLGEFNVLVATCIAEEGLDIGEVDLIVSFDALTSPVRMIQRMGRTGRKRVGRVIILVTEGDEEKKLARSASAAKTVSRALTTFKSKFTYSRCPRMLPTGICPQLRELEMKIPTFHASQVGGKTASGTVDPNLWQLSEAEQAVALMKYFPSNFAASSRNKLHPVVANRTHLLRRQPRSLVRKGMGTRVGYSSRSMMLQLLVRKIHSNKDILQTDSDDDDDKSDGNEIGAASSNCVLSDTTAEVTCGSLPSLDKTQRKISMVTDNAEGGREVGSSWRCVSIPKKLNGEGIAEVSFASMNESETTYDLHFSPQFVDVATHAASEVEDGEQLQGSITSRRDKQSSPPTASVDEMLSSALDLERSSGAQTHLSEIAENLCRLPNVSEEQCIGLDNVDSEERSQPMSIATDFPEGVLPRTCARIIRQLHFDEDEVGRDSLNQMQSAEPSLQEVTVPAEDADVRPKHEMSQVEDEGHSGFTFAMFSAKPCTGEVNTKDSIKDVTSNTDQVEKDSSACSFALLPPTEAENGGTISKHGLSAELIDATPHEREYQLVDDGTDGDDIDEMNEVDLVAKDELIFKTDTGISVEETREFGTAVKRDETTETQSRLKPCAGGTNVVTQMTVQIQLNGAEQEQTGEDSCSICLESESYDDDPIVFCDGCNVAVHQFCYGIWIVPLDKWFCDICADAKSSECAAKPNQRVCQLCPLRGGAYKQTKCGKWVHVQCYLWIPELRVEKSDDNVLVLGELSRLDPDRKTLDCSLCHSQKGTGIIQCAHKRCLAAFHVSCAAFAHYRMDQLDFPNEGDTECGALFMVYCPLHCNSKVPIISPEQQKTPLSTKVRFPEPPTPTVTETLSPSHLLTSPSSAEAKKKYKTFRRLKRKYDATQSQAFLEPGSSESPSSTSPWQKRIRRSKRRRETSRVLAAAYIEDTADVQGGVRSDDEDEDDYGDDYKEAADDSFINDSSQLLYSQSVVSPDEAEYSKSKKRKKSSPNMRAIYARSLFESQNSPLLLRRGGRELGALPCNGIIRACLTKLHNEENEVDFSRPRLRSPLVPQTAGDILETQPISATAAVTESDDNDSFIEAEPSPSFDLLGAAKPLEIVQASTCGPVEQREVKSMSTADIEMASPFYNSRVTERPLAGAANGSSGCDTLEGHMNDAELHRKIEANRMKALIKLEERRQAKLQQAAQFLRPHDAAALSNNGLKEALFHKVAEHSRASIAATTSKKPDKDESADHHYASRQSQNSSTQSSQRTATTVDLTSLKPIRPGSIQESQPSWVIFVSSSFASSSGYATFLSGKHTNSNVVIDSTLETDVLLSVRMAVLFLTGTQLHDMALAAPAQNVVKSRRIRTLLAMHKKIVIAVVCDGGDLAEVLRLRQLPNVTVAVQPCFDFLCSQLHQLARQELEEGYELPSPSLCHRDSSGGRLGIDADFGSRLEFFRTIHPLSLDSALSLSFRFKNFAAGQVPVLKFNEMHWKRMLPWISESTAKGIWKHVNQKHMCGI